MQLLPSCHGCSPRFHGGASVELLAASQGRRYGRGDEGKVFEALQLANARDPQRVSSDSCRMKTHNPL